MERSGADLLTDRERECLLRVRDGLSSKEIAAELGISHHTVDLHLKRAMKALGAANRRDAARRIELPPVTPLPVERQPFRGLGTQSDDLADPPAGLLSSPLPRMETPPRLPVPFLRQGRQRNDLTPTQRLGAIVMIAVLLLIAVANFFNGLGALYTITG